MPKDKEMSGVGTRCFLVLAFAVFASVAGADTISISSVDGTWSGALPPGCCTIDNVSDPRTIRWGEPAGGGGQSGYDWSSTPTPFDVVADSGPFSLGVFVHQNFPIFAPVLTSVNLDFSLDFDPVGSPVPPGLGGQFLFTHEETPNAGPCAYGDSTGTGCDDRVGVTTPLINAPFTYDGGNNFFSLLGFSTDGGTTISPFFVTGESQSNEAQLYATITSTPIGVPEPSSVLLLGIGLAVTACRYRLRLS